MNKLYKHKTPSAKTMDAMYKDYKKGQAEKKKKAQVHQSYKKGGKNDPRGMGSVLAMGEKFDDIKKRLQDKSNRNKDAEMAKKMQKVAFAHRQEGTIMGTFGRKVIDKYDAPKKKKPEKKSAMLDKKKLDKAYGIREGMGAAYMPQAAS